MKTKQKMKNLVIVTIMSVLMTGCVSQYTINPYSKDRMDKEMQRGTFKSSNGIELPYRCFFPSVQYKVPMVIYLHGAGQRGTDNTSQLDVGVGSIMSITSESLEYNAVVVAPQCPSSVFWRDENMLNALSEFITKLKDSDIVDNNRVYVTGYSMGGDATWKIALKYPHLISTAVPICGGPLESMEPDRPTVDEETSELNIWAFNNFDDFTVRPTYSKYLFSQIWSYRINDNLNFTENIEGGHDSTDIYRNRKYMIWMLSTKKN